MPDSVRAAALTLCELGYHVTPLGHASKKALLPDWPNVIIATRESADRYFPNDNLGVGLMLGTEVEDGLYMVAVDVDMDAEVNRVRAALPANVPTKKGRKGATFILATRSTVATKRFKRKMEAGAVTVVEILGQRAQTVLPPSIHPDTRLPYEWVDCPLEKFRPLKLPLLTVAMMDEIGMIATGEASALFDLNDMAWMGAGGGGTIDGALLGATGVMVQRGWVDEDIVARCDRAVASALRRSEHSGTWNDAVYRKRLKGMIDDARAKGFADRKPRKKSRDEKRLEVASMLIDQLGGFDMLWRDGPLLRRYMNGYWPVIDSAEMIRDILHYDRSWIEVHDAELIVRQVHAMAPARTRPKQPRICLLNGTVDVTEDQLRDWMPEDCLIAQLPIRWDPDAHAPNWEALLTDVFSQDNIEVTAERTDEDMEDDQIRSVRTFEEFVGLTLVEDLRFQKMLIVKGPPASGKSTLMNAVMALHDPDAVSTVPIAKLHEDRMMATLMGKLLNVSPEVKYDSFVDDEMIKCITTGDPVTIRLLYHEASPKVVLPTRIMMACNRMFRAGDTSGAMERRMIILEGGQTRKEKDWDKNLEGKLRRELAGVLVRVIEALRRLYQRGHFDPPRISALRVASFSEANNPVLIWMKERTHEGQRWENPDYKVALNGTGELTSNLYADYREWSDRCGYRPMSLIAFGMRLSELQFPTMQAKLGKLSVRVRRIHLLDKGAY